MKVGDRCMLSDRAFSLLGPGMRKRAGYRGGTICATDRFGGYNVLWDGLKRQTYEWKDSIILEDLARRLPRQITATEAVQLGDVR